MQMSSLLVWLLFRSFGTEGILRERDLRRTSLGEVNSCRCWITFTLHWTSVTLGNLFTPGGRPESPTS